MNALQMDFEDKTFDLVWACESGEHMPDKKSYAAPFHHPPAAACLGTPFLVPPRFPVRQAPHSRAIRPVMLCNDADTSRR